MTCKRCNSTTNDRTEVERLRHYIRHLQNDIDRSLTLLHAVDWDGVPPDVAPKIGQLLSELEPIYFPGGIHAQAPTANAD